MKTSDALIFGVDTETYSVGGRGLLSIQIYRPGIEKLFTFDAGAELLPDEMIREDLARRFFDWLEALKCDCRLFFFNITFDFSQVERYAINRYALARDPRHPAKGEISILQSETKVYQVKIRLYNGRLVIMRDLFHITQSSLEDSCRAFLGKGKLAMHNKGFKKAPMPQIVREYAMEDAKLTYELAVALAGLEGIDMTLGVTVAGAALKNFEKFLKGQLPERIMGRWLPRLEERRDSIGDWAEVPRHWSFETMRPHARGGNVAAFRPGVFEGDMIHIDIHSAHPSQMVKAIPFGHDSPDWKASPGVSLIDYVFPRGRFYLKKDAIPCVLFKSNMACERYSIEGEELKAAEWAHSFRLDGSFGFWGDEWRIILSQYEREPMDYYTKRRLTEEERERLFRQTGLRVDEDGMLEGQPEQYDEVTYFRGREDPFLSAWVNFLYEGKQSEKGAKSTVFKYLLNGLYGKFLQKSTGETILYEWEGDRVKRTPAPDAGRREVYLPLGSWIASQTRCEWLRTAIAIGHDRLIYGDTDSLIFDRFDGWEEVVNYGPGLGQWGDAYKAHPEKVNIVGRKTYQEDFGDGRIVTKCAGLPIATRAAMGFGILEEGATFKTVKARRDPETLAINIIEDHHTVSSRPQAWRV